MHYLLFYEVADDYVARRAQFREKHLAKAWEASQRGELILAGALANPVDGAVLLFHGESPEVAEKFARTDPYVIGGAVKRWRVREWTTVVGPQAATPVLPTPAEGAKTIDSSLSAKSQPAVLRMWKAASTPQNAPKYVEHATQKVFPALRGIKGHRGAYLLRRTVHSAIELVVLTLWESMDAVRKFAGGDAEKAVVEPEAQAVLASFDESVDHFEVIAEPGITEPGITDSH